MSDLSIVAVIPLYNGVYSNLDFADGDGCVTPAMVLNDPRCGTHPKLSVRQCVREDTHMLPSATLISREAFEAVGGFDEQFVGFEHGDLFLHLLYARYRNVYINETHSR
jgi:hypothetical protein